MTTAVDLPELHLPGLPFDGLNLERARAVNDALIGYEVRIHGERDYDGGAESAHRDRSTVHVFLGIVLPGRSLGLEAPYDLRLQYGRHGGSCRIVSASLILRFEVLPGPELTPCADCRTWKPMTELKDTAYRPLEVPGYGLVCRKDCPAGYE